jgi:hypothetical protein
MASALLETSAPCRPPVGFGKRAKISKLSPSQGLKGEVARPLMAKALELLAQPPAIHQVDVLGDKPPG